MFTNFSKQLLSICGGGGEGGSEGRGKRGKGGGMIKPDDDNIKQNSYLVSVMKYYVKRYFLIFAYRLNTRQQYMHSDLSHCSLIIVISTHL